MTDWGQLYRDHVAAVSGLALAPGRLGGADELDEICIFGARDDDQPAPG